MVPTTYYAKSGDVHIAYQVVGEGPSTWCLFMAGSPILNISGRIPRWLGFSTSGFFQSADRL
jgi:hypothetical protein